MSEGNKMKKTILIIALLVFVVFATSAIAERIIIKPDRQPNQLDFLGISFMPDTLIKQASFKREGIALALSGGGARGLAHIGVLEVLQENNIPIKFIAGTSMGAVVGGLHCAGYTPKELHELVLGIDWNGLFSPAPLRSSILTSAKGWPEKALLKIGVERGRPVLPMALTSGQKLSNLLTRLCYRNGVRASISFDLLNPPFRATATDLANGQLCVISSGDLADALRATMAFPIGFTPVLSDGHLYVDGGLLNPVPVDLCLRLSGNPVIAVNVTSPLLPINDISDAIDMANQSTTVMSLSQLNDQLAQADVIVIPPIGFHKASDFNEIESLIQAGRRATQDCLPQIMAAMADKKTEVGPQYSISQVTIDGPMNLPKSLFAAYLINVGSHSEWEIKNSLEEIIAGGYVNDAQAILDKDEGSYSLTYRIIDNPRIRNFVFPGRTLFSEQVIFAEMKSRPGQVANYNQLGVDIKAIEQKYAASEYTLARAQLASIDSLTGQVTIAIDEGRINDIRVIGNKRTKPWVIMRDFHLKAGDIFREKKAQASLDDLYATGLFETVKLSAQPCSSGIRLIIKVEEKTFDFIRLGTRYDNEYRASGFIDMVASNIMGTGNDINLATLLGEKKQVYMLNVKADRIFETYLTYRMTATRTNFKRNYYVNHRHERNLFEQSTGFEFEAGQQFPRFGKISVVLDIAKHRFDSPDAPARTTRHQTSVSFRSLVDSFDALPLPERGKYHYFDLEFAGDVFGGDILYTKFYTSLEAYYPIYRGLNFHPRIAMGLYNRRPPYFMLFDLGGHDSFYGLFKHELMGEKILNGSLELRQKLTGYLYITARYDVGDFWSSLSSMRLKSLRHGIGGSVILKTFLGPIGLAYGRTTENDDAVYFYMGYDY
jgi:NTE family protein